MAFTTFNHGRIARFGAGATILRAATNDGLSDEQLQAAAPSVFANEAHGSRSERYTYIPTSEVLKGLRAEGFVPFEVRQGGSRDDEKRAFTKHLLRLRHAHDLEKQAGENVRELVMLNAHDGTSSYKLMSGVFRIVCSNGLIASIGEATEHRVAHKGDIVGNVIEGAYRIIHESEQVTAAIEDMRSVQLSVSEQDAFAEAALALRYEEGKAPDVLPAMIHRARRSADVGNDLWRTFNRTQETLINGGVHYTHRAANGARSRRESRPVNGIDGNVALNRALWVLADKMAEIKGGSPLAA
jgi:hypothetical protein